MRSILLGAALATFAAFALGRYLPSNVFASSSESQHRTVLSIIKDSTTFFLPDALASSGPSPYYLGLTSMKGESGGNSDGRVTIQSIGDSAKDDLWFKHINKDRSLMCAMCGTDAAAGWQALDTRTPPSAASKWVNFIEMAIWYWFEAKHDRDICDMYMHWSLRTTFPALKVNPKSNKAGTAVQCFRIRHQNEGAGFPNGVPRRPIEQSYTADGKLYHVCF